MIHLISLLLLLIFFLFLTSSINYEHFSSNENIYTLSNNSFQFQNQTVIIDPPNLSITPNNLKIIKKSNLIYNLVSGDNQLTIHLSFSKEPVNIIVNNHQYNILFKQSKKENNVYNMFLYGKVCGNLRINKNKIIIKNTRDEINNITNLTGIFFAFLMFDEIEKSKNIDYDKLFTES